MILASLKQRASYLGVGYDEGLLQANVEIPSFSKIFQIEY